MLNCIFSCTLSKTLEHSPELSMAHYAGLQRWQAARAWKRAVETSEIQTSVARLYKGGYWSTTRQLVQDIQVPMRAYVASAGVGLREFQDRAPAYAATFNQGVKDSIPNAATQEGRRWWWEQLGGSTALRALAVEGDRIAVALPGHYLTVATPDLLHIQNEIGARSLAVFTTDSEAIDQLGASAVALDARMSRVLGGPVGHVTVRALDYVLRRVGSAEEVSAFTAQHILEDVRRRTPEELFPKRKRQTEPEVAQWIVQALSGPNPPSSASAALRRFRDEGFGFEQKRFGRVFRSVKEDGVK